ncbi:hypothetical protein PGTUg99_000029 [Puccinia graminis f. sp. tritici]|uniref:Uncharacterized protein n=1 Tax=Puccinia graminis f. sp. tritici TaxID=56615 RepID=A0A5B0RUW3_PUCGR|nr:hypothetical protein PGTUg99_000029 [Puccinia graminis f. sp. tritici]
MTTSCRRIHPSLWPSHLSFPFEFKWAMGLAIMGGRDYRRTGCSPPLFSMIAETSND